MLLHTSSWQHALHMHAVQLTVTSDVPYMVCTYDITTKQTKLPHHNFKSYWFSVERKYKYELNNDNTDMWLVSYIGLYKINHILFIMPI